MKEFIMDSAVILNNFNFSFNENERYITTNRVLDEIIDLRSKQLIEFGLKNGKIIVKEPSKKSLEIVKHTAKIHRLDSKLSNADISILALALDLKKTLLSDDFKVQKMCLFLDIKFDSIFREKIKK
jgi:rRNA maturation endonuclease Nob1